MSLGWLEPRLLNAQTEPVAAPWLRGLDDEEEGAWQQSAVVRARLCACLLVQRDFTWCGHIDARIQNGSERHAIAVARRYQQLRSVSDGVSKLRMRSLQNPREVSPWGQFRALMTTAHLTFRALFTHQRRDDLIGWKRLRKNDPGGGRFGACVAALQMVRQSIAGLLSGRRYAG